MTKARSKVVGIRSADRWHQGLRRETGTPLETPKEGNLGEQLVRLLAALQAHVLEYLREEERLLRTQAGIGLQAHLQAHGRIRERTRELNLRFSQGGSSMALAEDTSRVVLEWLQSHVQSMDRVLAHERAQRGSTQQG